MYFKKTVKKAAKKASRYLNKRYFKKKSNYTPKWGRIEKDVAYLKSVLNPEKKKHQQNFTDGLVGQCNGNLSAYFILDVTPNPAQGTTSITRNGNSIKLHSAYLKMQFQNQAASNVNPMRLRVMLIQVIGQPITSNSVFVERFLKPNSFIPGVDIYDYFSDRDEEAFKQFRVLRSKNVYIKANQHSGQQSITNIGCGIKYKNYHVKFAADGSTTVMDGQMFLLVLADSGNVASATTSTLTGTAVTATNTGAYVQMDLTNYFYDN